MADRFQVRGLPTLLFLVPDEADQPEVAHRFEGAAPGDYIVQLAEYAFFAGPEPEFPDINSLYES